MKKIIFLLLLCSFLCSCKENRKDKISYLITEWLGKEIIFPNSLIFTQQGQDTVEYSLFHTSHMIVSYVDSAGCMSCKLQLSRWRSFITELDSISQEKTPVFLYFCPKNIEEITYLLKRDYFDHPVCIDQSDIFSKLNKFPDKAEFHTFLLDENNKVLALGNPILNPEIKKLYLNIIQGKKTCSNDNNLKTEVSVEMSNVSLGRFDWQQEQKVEFILENIGNQPLVINDVVTSCGCVKASCSKEPVRPNGAASLFVTYKAEQPEHFDKTIKVYCNAESSPILLKLTGDAK